MFLLMICSGRKVDCHVIYRMQHSCVLKVYVVSAVTTKTSEKNIMGRFAPQHRERNKYLDIFVLSDSQRCIEHQYLLSRFLGVSILQFLLLPNCKVLHVL
jgi:hypothetical protein